MWTKQARDLWELELDGDQIALVIDDGAHPALKGQRYGWFLVGAYSLTKPERGGFSRTLAEAQAEAERAVETHRALLLAERAEARRLREQHADWLATYSQTPA